MHERNLITRVDEIDFPRFVYREQQSISIPRHLLARVLGLVNQVDRIIHPAVLSVQLLKCFSLRRVRKI